ncbi:MAG: phage holin family protein [Balneolaceae bacterium]
MAENKSTTATDQEENYSLKEEIRAYIDARVQLFTMNIAEKISLIIADSVQKILGLTLLGASLYFFCFALAFYLGDFLDNYSIGFAIVAIPFLLFGAIFLNRKSKRLTEKIQADIIGKMITDNDSDDLPEKIGGKNTGQ